MNNKFSEVAAHSTRVENQKQAMVSDKTKIDNKTAEYTELIQNIEERTKIETENRRLKYSVPTLLNKIMYAIPVNVQLTSINNSGTKIIITAQSDKYDPLGIFVAKLRNDAILTNIVTDQSKKSDSVIVVTIEGELP